MRKPDFIIGTAEDPYLLRWYIIPRNPIFNIYLHNIVKSDDERATHDHPWVNVSIILKGGYWEVLPCHKKYPFGSKYMVWRKPWSMVFRLPKDSHRLIIDDEIKNVWTLFFTGPRVREWGFYCPKGWRVWHEFATKEKGVSSISKGCD